MQHSKTRSHRVCAHAQAHLPRVQCTSARTVVCAVGTLTAQQAPAADTVLNIAKVVDADQYMRQGSYEAPLVQAQVCP